MANAIITGWGKCLPSSRLSNQDLSQFLETNDDWIYSRTGIKERRISAHPVSDMAAVAAQNALDCAGVLASDLDLVLLCTTTPDNLIPSAASKTLLKLKATEVPCMDVNAACGGFVYGMHLVKALIESGMHRRIMLIGAERLSWFQNWSQRSTSVLFGDGAGALIFQSSESVKGIVSSHIGADPGGNDAIKVTDFGAGYNRYLKTAPQLNFLFDGKDVFRQAVGRMVSSCRSCLAEQKLTHYDVDLFLGHQANSRILDTVGNQLRIPKTKVFKNLQHYGNTSAASIPIALCESFQQNKVNAGQRIMIAAFGAGFSYGAAIVHAPIRLTPMFAPETEELQQSQTAMEILQQAIDSDLARTESVQEGNTLPLAS